MRMNGYLKRMWCDLTNKPCYNDKYLEKNRFGRRYANCIDDDEVWATLADSDCLVPKRIIKAGKQRLSTRFLVYSFEDEKMKNEIVKYYHRKYKLYEVQNEAVELCVGVLRFIQLATNVFSNPGDTVCLSTPCYGTFQNVFADNKMDRNLVFNHLIFNEEDHSTYYDWDALEKIFSNPKTKIYILCSPHNPTGEQWKKDNLIILAKLAKKHNVFVISDEIWQDISFDETEHHIPFFSCCKEAAENSIVVSNPLKNFNCGGMNFGYAICLSNENRERLRKGFSKTITYSSTNVVTYPMIKKMFNDKKLISWHIKNLKIIKNNFLFFSTNLREKTNIKVCNTEGMFLAWIDFSACVRSKAELDRRLKSIKVFLSDGTSQGGKKYELCCRVNISVDKKNLKRMVSRLCIEFARDN